MGRELPIILNSKIDVSLLRHYRMDISEFLQLVRKIVSFFPAALVSHMEYWNVGVLEYWSVGRNSD